MMLTLTACPRKQYTFNAKAVLNLMSDDVADSRVSNQVAGVIIAGGKSRRWGGGDKFLVEIEGKSLLQHVADGVRGQVRLLALNVNGPKNEYQELELVVIPDVVKENLGPLSGVLTGLDWVWENLPGVPWVLTVPADAPFLPDDLVRRLLTAVEEGGADMACVSSGGRAHPVIGLWPVALCDRLRSGLLYDDVRKVDIWTSSYKVACPTWSTDPFDPFFNINTHDDLDAAVDLITKL